MAGRIEGPPRGLLLRPSSTRFGCVSAEVSRRFLPHLRISLSENDLVKELPLFPCLWWSVGIGMVRALSPVSFVEACHCPFISSQPKFETETLFVLQATMHPPSTAFGTPLLKAAVVASVDAYPRPAGAPIRGFGGVSQGSVPLVELISSVKATLDPLVGKPLSVTAIVDIMNKVGAPEWKDSLDSSRRA